MSEADVTTRSRNDRARAGALPPVLVTSAQQSGTRELLVRAALESGLEHVVLEGPGTVAAMAGRAVHWYGGPLAADRVAARLGLGLLEPADA